MMLLLMVDGNDWDGDVVDDGDHHEDCWLK